MNTLKKMNSTSIYTTFYCLGRFNITNISFSLINSFVGRKLTKKIQRSF